MIQRRRGRYRGPAADQRRHLCGAGGRRGKECRGSVLPLREFRRQMREGVVMTEPQRVDLDEIRADGDGCCAIGGYNHPGPCAWVCNDCHGSTYCWACGGPLGDDMGTGCGECDGTGYCYHCYEGMVGDD